MMVRNAPHYRPEYQPPKAMAWQSLRHLHTTPERPPSRRSFFWYGRRKNDETKQEKEKDAHLSAQKGKEIQTQGHKERCEEPSEEPRKKPFGLAEP